MSSTPRSPQVSPNNPCPFLRALVAHGLLADDVAAVGEVTKTIINVASAGDGQPQLPSSAIRAIALVANGRYLSLVEVRELFVERRLPARLSRRLAAMPPVTVFPEELQSAEG